MRNWTAVLAVLVAVALVPESALAAGGKESPSAARPAASHRPIPPCGPEVAAVLGGEDDTACLPGDPGLHGSATVRLGAGKPSGKKPGR